MGICQDLILSSLLSLSLSLSLSPTVRMLFLPRLSLLLFVAFIVFCCLTPVKPKDLPTCESVVAECKKEPKNKLFTCNDGRPGIKCIMGCDMGKIGLSYCQGPKILT